MTTTIKRYAVIVDGLYPTVEAETDDYTEALEVFIDLHKRNLNVCFCDGDREYNPLIED